jgi:dTMP kinase
MGKKGVFIVIEGLDGSGKTTQATLLTKNLEKDYKVLLTAEPSCGKIGSFIRRGCLYEDKRLPTEAEALIFAADRIEHMYNEVKPALDEGKIVICDRYIYSSLSYQGSVGLSLEWIKTINARGLLPEIAFFIDVKPEELLKRSKRKPLPENLESQQKIRDIYFKFVETGELILVEGDKPKDVLANELFSKVSVLLKNR